MRKFFTRMIYRLDKQAAFERITRLHDKRLEDLTKQKGQLDKALVKEDGLAYHAKRLAKNIKLMDQDSFSRLATNNDYLSQTYDGWMSTIGRDKLYSMLQEKQDSHWMNYSLYFLKEFARMGEPLCVRIINFLSSEEQKDHQPSVIASLSNVAYQLAKRKMTREEYEGILNGRLPFATLNCPRGKKEYYLPTIALDGEQNDRR